MKRPSPGSRTGPDPRAPPPAGTRMPPAPPIPPPVRDGAPVAVLVDYDGTISRRDIGSLLLDRHAADRAALARYDAAYDAGTIGSAELLLWDLTVLPDGPETLRAEAAAVPQDAGIVDLVRVVRARGGLVEVVSDGLGFYIEENLGRLGLTDLPVATNGNELRGPAGASFPYGEPSCGWCGTCKRGRVLAHRAAGRLVILVGDGTSDRFAAHHADLVLATGRLADWCAAHGRPVVRWSDLGEVATWLEQAWADGRLPAAGAPVPPPPAPDPAWICGPEAWGGGTPPVRAGT